MVNFLALVAMMHIQLLSLKTSPFSNILVMVRVIVSHSLLFIGLSFLIWVKIWRSWMYFFFLTKFLLVCLLIWFVLMIILTWSRTHAQNISVWNSRYVLNFFRWGHFHVFVVGDGVLLHIEVMFGLYGFLFGSNGQLAVVLRLNFIFLVLIAVVDIRDFHFTFQSGIKSIFYMVICATWQVLCDFRPFVSKFLVESDDGHVLLVGPLVFLDVGVQMIVPPLTTLLSNSPWQSLCNVTPILGSKLCNIFREFLIFFSAPWTFDHWGIQNFLPPVKTLDISAIM